MDLFNPSLKERLQFLGFSFNAEDVPAIVCVL